MRQSIYCLTLTVCVLACPLLRAEPLLSDKQRVAVAAAVAQEADAAKTDEAQGSTDSSDSDKKGSDEAVAGIEGQEQEVPDVENWTADALSFFKDLNKELRARASHRERHLNIIGDDARGSRSAVNAYFDDATLVSAYVDLPFIIDFFNSHGPSLGIFLSREKTKILTLPSEEDYR